MPWKVSHVQDTQPGMFGGKSGIGFFIHEDPRTPKLVWMVFANRADAEEAHRRIDKILETVVDIHIHH